MHHSVSDTRHTLLHSRTAVVPYCNESVKLGSLHCMLRAQSGVELNLNLEKLPNVHDPHNPWQLRFFLCKSMVSSLPGRPWTCSQVRGRVRGRSLDGAADGRFSCTGTKVSNVGRW